MALHSKYIKRCIEIAKNGLGTTAPNPMVGCVIVEDNKIIGEGYTSPYGGAHAEVNAIDSVKDKIRLKKATLYVTLEPCSHHGKTPPCCDLIIAHEIPKVVIGCVDAHEKVCGQGIARLRASGCEVILGAEEALCKEHHKRFLTYHLKKRPYIILKWAETKNGFVAPNKTSSKRPFWISGKMSRQLVHQWRAEEQAILVGANTLIEDNPSLTTRHVIGKNPTRIVISNKKLHSKKYDVFNADAETIVIDTAHLKNDKPLAGQICEKLFERKINSLIVEGGPKTIQQFIDENLWDEARVFEGNAEIENGIKAPKFSIRSSEALKVGEDRLWTFTNNLF
ncbi:MAG TPA: bifunctional diaminohydroxyphosphoribosylaminopyrimidine deaminase/5-amino-6-(5-phosphoribosylamino)uracil reductase RibD [Flavobacteriaceae bacterium]|nr:bifunctional diaminohydroxyphosphoribosylaminopyrimidine deaminase/5-amino-6-(5-phosphoribosylamino)uracil reductase RibD [Flavobacteriaceae bacterium]